MTTPETSKPLTEKKLAAIEEFSSSLASLSSVDWYVSYDENSYSVFDKTHGSKIASGLTHASARFICCSRNNAEELLRLAEELLRLAEIGRKYKEHDEFLQDMDYD